MKNNHNNRQGKINSFFSVSPIAGTKKNLVIRLSKRAGTDDMPPSQERSSALAPHGKGISVRGRVLHPVFYHSARVAAFILLLSAVVSGTSMVGNTVSYYADVESSVGNSLIADPLSFTLTPENRNIDMSTSSDAFIASLIPDVTSEPIKYTIGTVMTGGNETLCSLITLHAPTYGYDGSLLLFSTVATTSLYAIPMSFSFPENLAPGDNTSCFMDLVFSGRNADAEEGRGYSDTHKISLQFYIPDPANPESATSTPNIITFSASTTDMTAGTSSDAKQFEDATSTATTTQTSQKSQLDGEVAGAATGTPPVPPAVPEPESGGTGITPPPPQAPLENIESTTTDITDATSTEATTTPDTTDSTQSTSTLPQGDVTPPADSSTTTPSSDASNTPPLIDPTPTSTATETGEQAAPPTPDPVPDASSTTPPSDG